LSSFESANGIHLSVTNSPWKTHYNESCFICKYFGHGIQTCPNILSEYKGACIRCFQGGHFTDSCTNTQREPPMKQGFKDPSYFL
jgi:hypothetical protein